MPRHGGQLWYVPGPADEVRLWLVPDLGQMRSEGSVRPRRGNVAEQQFHLPKSGDTRVRADNGPLGGQHQCDDTGYQSRQDIQGKEDACLLFLLVFRNCRCQLIACTEDCSFKKAGRNMKISTNWDSSRRRKINVSFSKFSIVKWLVNTKHIYIYSRCFTLRFIT